MENLTGQNQLKAAGREGQSLASIRAMHGQVADFLGLEHGNARRGEIQSGDVPHMRRHSFRNPAGSTAYLEDRAEASRADQGKKQASLERFKEAPFCGTMPSLVIRRLKVAQRVFRSLIARIHQPSPPSFRPTALS